MGSSLIIFLLCFIPMGEYLIVDTQSNDWGFRVNFTSSTWNMPPNRKTLQFTFSI
jgi:hypothetical protein